MSRVGWVFDALPPSGARRGGNPAEHAFRADLATFVREVVQNANDQAHLRPTVRFRYVSLAGPERARFLEALRWGELEPHLRAATKLQDTARLLSALETAAAGDALSLLFIDDFGTDGLTGGDDEEGTHFRALCKDTLFSNKREKAAGGSYGLGKSVLWIFSSFSTVLFRSTLLETQGQTNPRLIGRTELGSHTLGPKRAFQGPGWFGEERKQRRGARAESVWGNEAAAMSEALGFHARTDHDTGTSICVVGFKDPTADAELGPAELARATREALAEYFWPSMSLPSRALKASTEAEDQLVDVRPQDADVAPFVVAWESYLRGNVPAKGTLAQPGDMTVLELPVTIPATRAGEPAVSGRVALIIRLAAKSSEPRAGQVAFFRGPGMVVSYRDRSRLALGMRPFHAVLACGRARQPRDPSAEDGAVEAFLRMSEPPAHDRWESTPRLKAHYRAGYAKALKELSQRVDDALKEVLIASHVLGERGPERLQRRFPIGKAGSTGKGRSAFGMSRLDARPHRGAWVFSATIERKLGQGPWAVQVRLGEVDEAGRRTEEVAIVALSVDVEAEVVVDGSMASVTVPADIRTVPFSGMSAPSAFTGALELELVGRGVSDER